MRCPNYRSVSCLGHSMAVFTPFIGGFIYRLRTRKESFEIQLREGGDKWQEDTTET